MERHNDSERTSCAVLGQAVAEEPRSSSFNLNLDVIRMILSFCHASDLLQISLVSHQLRDEAMKEIVSRPVSLTGHRRAQSFGRFMLTSCENPPFPLLKTLVLDDIDLEWERHMVAKRKQVDNSEVLLTMMERATSLRSLEIHRCDRYLADSRFMQAIRAMRHLNHLCIFVGKQESHQHVADLMHGLTWSLKTMEYPAVIDGDDSPILQALFHSLPQLQPQLETLRIAIQSLTSLTLPSLFLHVRVLDLTVTVDNSISLEQLVSVFPTLKELSISMYELQLADVNHPSTEMVAARSAAAALQASGRGWPRLELLGGPIADLYVLSIACPVFQLHLCHYSEHAHHAWIDVISRTRPKRVDLDLFCSPWFEVGAAQPNIFVYGGEDPGAVTHLVVRLSITTSPPAPSTSKMIETVTPFLQDSRVEYLHLAIAELFPRGEIDEDFLTPHTVHAELKATMAGIDVGYLVSGLAACGTCLRTVVLSLVTRDQSVWAVDRIEGQQTWRRLDAYVGRTVVAREEAAVR